MAPIKNTALIYVSEPDGFIQPGVHLKVVEKEIDLATVPLNGGVLLKTLVLGSDPYLRYRMRDPKVESFCPPLIPGEIVDNGGVGKVIRSDDPKFKPGDIVQGYLDFAEYSIYPDKMTHFYKLPLSKLDKHPDIPLTAYLGILGMPGHTAYTGFKTFLADKLKDAKTFFITTGGGPVGSFLIQYTKLVAPHIKIIASAGSEDKVAFMKKIGADVPFNYKTQDTNEVLKAHGPIDFYWDSIGGATLDAALLNIKPFGSIVACGTMDATSKESIVRHWREVFQRSLYINGIVVYTGPSAAHLSTFYDEIVPLVLQGKIKYTEQRYNGIKDAGNAVADHHVGKNYAKAVIAVADD